MSGALVVKLHACRELLAGDSTGKSDPYVLFQLIDMQQGPFSFVVISEDARPTGT